MQGRPLITDHNEIITIAMQMLLEGNSALTIRELAKELGVATGLVYNYFPNKAQIINAVAERALSELWYHWSDKTAWEPALRQWMTAFYSAALESPDMALVLQLAADTPGAIEKQQHLAALLQSAGLSKAASYQHAESLIEIVIATASFNGGRTIDVAKRNSRKTKALVAAHNVRWQLTVDRNIAGIKALAR